MKKLLCVCIIVVLLYGFYRYAGKVEVYSVSGEEPYVSTESIPEAVQEDGAQDISAQEEEKPLLEGEAESSMILEDRDFIYFYNGSKIVKINKESKNSDVLWKSDYTEQFMPEVKALLIEDQIYFLEKWWSISSCTIEYELSVINTDGTGYTRIEEADDSSFCFSDLYFADGILYVSTHDSVIEYILYADGTWGKNEAVSEDDLYRNLAQMYEEIYISSCPAHIFFAMQSLKNYGYILFNKNGVVVKVSPESGEETEVLEKGTIRAVNEQYFLADQYNNGVDNLYLIDAETLKIRYFTECSGSVIDMDEKYVYVIKSDYSEDRGASYIYERIALADGEKSSLFSQKEFVGVNSGFYGGVFGDCADRVVGICDNYIYYVGEVDYKLYLMRRNLDEPSEEEVLGEAFYDSGISEVGSVVSCHERNYSKEKVDDYLIAVDFERLVVDERFSGAAEINRIFEDKQEEIVAYEKQNAKDVEGILESTTDPDFSLHYHCVSLLSPIYYYDGHYLSLYQDDDDYGGGGHGILYREGYTFDLQTGQRLTLQDVIGNDEEELKDIVTQYFSEYIDENAGTFWDDAKTSVKEQITLESDFYLKEDGICFYFPPYALAPFAAGFPEVTIPYEEFEIKIPLKEVAYESVPVSEVVAAETVCAKVRSMDFAAIQLHMDITPEENLLYLEGYLRILKNEMPTYNQQGEELYYRDLWKADIEFQELLEARDQRKYPYLYYYDDLDGDGKPELGIEQGCIYILKYELGDDKFTILYSQQTCYFKKIVGVGQIWYHDGVHGNIIRDRLIVLNEENEWEEVLNLERGLIPDSLYYMVGTEDMDQAKVSEEEWNELTMPFFEMAEDNEIPLQTLEEVFGELL